MKKHKIKTNTQLKPASVTVVNTVINKEESAGKEWIIILILFFAAFFIRCIYLFQAQEYATLSTSLSDPASVDEAARGFVKEGKISSEFYWHAPFYPFFLSFLYSISGSSILFAKIVQMIIGSLTVVFVYLLAIDFLKKQTALIAAGLAALCFPLIFFEGELYSEGLAALFCVLLLYTFIKIKNKPSLMLCYASGIIGAASVTTRPVFLIFVIASVVWCVWCWIKLKTNYKKIAHYSIMIILGLLTLLLPICFINLAFNGVFSFLPYSGGINFFIGNNIDYDYTITIRPGYAWDQLIKLPNSEGITGVLPMDNYFNSRAWEFIVSRPLDFIKGFLVKTVEFISAREIPRTEDIYMFREEAPLLGVGVWKAGGFGFPFGVLFPLAIIGIVGFRKRIPGPVWLLLLLYPLAVIVIFVSSRYRAPILPVICLLAACGITWMYELVKKKKWKSLGISSAVVFAVAILISLPGPFIEEKMDLRAEFNLSEGIYYNRIGNYDSAIVAFERALSRRPCNPKTAYELGVVYFELKQSGKAEKELDKVLHWPMSCFFNDAGIPGNDIYIENHKSDFKEVYSTAIADTHSILGNIMLAKNLLDDAVLHFNEAVKLLPDRFDIIEVIGDIRLKQKNYQEALSLLKQALPYDSNNPALYSKFGLASMETGDLDNAIMSFSKAIELQPVNQYAFYSLGNIYYEKNDINKAIEYFQAVLKITPIEPYTLYKLGLCYMKLSDNKAAESFFIQSLQIKPDNPPVQDALKKLTGK